MIGVLTTSGADADTLAVRAAMNRDRRPGEGYFDSVRNKVDEQNELPQRGAEAPAGAAIHLQVVLSLIAVLILMIALSPVELGWWWLIGSLFTGGLSPRGASSTAKERSRRCCLLETLPPSDRNGRDRRVTQTA